MPNRPLISVVSPVYRAEKLIDRLILEVEQALSTLTADYEIILVEDGGPDNSWEQILKNAQKNNKVKGIKLSRNFGQHYAITAGLEAASGEWIVVMDCDLQDRPDEIPNLYQKALEGYDIVFAQRINRQDGLLKRLSSRMFYAVFSYLTGIKQDRTVANFGIFNHKVIKAVLNMRDAVRAFPMLVQWVGFDKAYLPVKHDERAEGKSSYTFLKLIRLAFDVIISFSQRPLYLTMQLGILISGIVTLVGVYYLLLYFMGKVMVMGYTSLILSIWFLAGIMIAIMGMLGLYIGKIFEQVKNRPLYIVNHKINLDEDESS